MYSIANQLPITLEPYLSIFENSDLDSLKVCKIISTVGKALKSKAEYCTSLLITRLGINADKNALILREISQIAAVYPNVMGIK